VQLVPLVLKDLKAFREFRETQVQLVPLVLKDLKAFREFRETQVQLVPLVQLVSFQVIMS
jgi:hypothetical protein